MHYNTILKWLFACVCALWAYIEPTLPYALICLFAVVLDCISAVRLNRRVKKAYPDGGAVGKFKSQHGMKMVSDVGMVFGVIILATMVDKLLITNIDLLLGNYVSAIFCFVEIWSVLENESSCNGSGWARVLQKIMVDKTKRHLDIDFDITPKTEREDGKL